jgi:hypothetical protein
MSGWRARPADVLEARAAGRLRHPRFVGLRRDKDPEEVVRERPRQVPA